MGVEPTVIPAVGASLAKEDFNWTSEHVATLTQLWSDGLSASRIASKIGHRLTRNAVLGKVHRLKLPERSSSARNSGGRPRNPREPSIPSLQPATDTLTPEPLPLAVTVPEIPIAPVASGEELTPVKQVVESEGNRVTLFNLSDKTCKWPIGDPMHKDFYFCGRKPREGSPYCEYHARLAYQPLQGTPRGSGRFPKLFVITSS